MESLKVILIRHGETVGNTRKVIQGQQPGLLSPKGMYQAREAGEHLARIYQPEVLYSSDLERASSTAGIIGKVFSLPVTLDVRLRERSFGSLEGQPVFRIRRAMLEQKTGLDNVEIADAEPPVSFRMRIEYFLAEITTLSRSLILAVTHYGVIDYILRSRGSSAACAIANCTCILLSYNGSHFTVERSLD